jgi:hypothetical protein
VLLDGRDQLVVANLAGDASIPKFVVNVGDVVDGAAHESCCTCKARRTRSTSSGSACSTSARPAMAATASRA